MGRAATAGVLLATLTKSREQLTAELSGGGPLGSLIVDAGADGGVGCGSQHPAAPVAALPGIHVPLGRALGPRGARPGGARPGSAGDRQRPDPDK